MTQEDSVLYYTSGRITLETNYIPIYLLFTFHELGTPLCFLGDVVCTWELPVYAYILTIYTLLGRLLDRMIVVCSLSV